MKQLTKEEAVKFHDDGLWKDMSMEHRAAFQTGQQLLCMPFTVFHEAVERVLDRPVFTHEFAFPGLRDEVMGNVKAPSFDEIVGLLQKDKIIVVVTE